MRVGLGYDVHKLVEGRDLIIGGVQIPYEKGLLGHSDADVLLHAIMDALLGAAALGDIGKHFPDTDSKYKGISSIKLLEYVRELIDDELYVVTYGTATSLTASGEDALSVVKAISDYSTALNQVMGGSFCTTDKDAEVIKACDKVFEKHQALYPSLKGYVEIRKTVGTTSSPDEELPSTVVKTYTYE